MRKEVINFSISFIFTAYVKIRENIFNKKVSVVQNNINFQFYVVLGHLFGQKYIKASSMCRMSRMCVSPLRLHKGTKSRCPWNDELYSVVQRAGVNENPKCHPNIATRRDKDTTAR
jgi:hypothetical protein